MIIFKLKFGDLHSISECESPYHKLRNHRGNPNSENGFLHLEFCFRYLDF